MSLKKQNKTKPKPSKPTHQPQKNSLNLSSWWPHTISVSEKSHVNFAEQELLPCKRHRKGMVILCPKECHLSSLAIPVRPNKKQWGCDSSYLSFTALLQCILPSSSTKRQNKRLVPGHFWMGGSLDPSSMESGPGFLLCQRSHLASADLCWFK